MEGPTGVDQRLTQPVLCRNLQGVVTVEQYQCGCGELKGKATAQHGPGESRWAPERTDDFGESSGPTDIERLESKGAKDMRATS